MYLRLIVLLLPPLLSSCTLPGSDAEPVSRKHPNEPDIRLNPNPVRAHRVTVTLEDAPGPFQKVEGFAQYAGHYEKRPSVPCSYTASGIGNVRLRKNNYFDLKKISANVYQGTVYSDRILDEDYGKGRCLWVMTEVRARMRAHDNLTDTRFAPHLNRLLNPSEKSMTRHFWKGRYPRASIDDHVEFGHADREKFKSELRDDLFSITISIEEDL